MLKTLVGRSLLSLIATTLFVFSPDRTASFSFLSHCQLRRQTGENSSGLRPLIPREKGSNVQFQTHRPPSEIQRLGGMSYGAA